MTFAQSFQQAKEFFCTLHHCTHFCFPYGKKPELTKLDHSVWGEKKPQQNNKPINKTQASPGCDRQPVCPAVLKSAASLNGGWGEGRRGLPSTSGISKDLLEVWMYDGVFLTNVFVNEPLRTAGFISEGKRFPKPAVPAAPSPTKPGHEGRGHPHGRRSDPSLFYPKNPERKESSVLGRRAGATKG